MRNTDPRKIGTWRSILIITGGALVYMNSPAGAEPVTFESSTGGVEIRVSGRPVATYVWNDPEVPRPFFAHLRSPNEALITRHHPPDHQGDAENDDHATFHPGVWLAFGELGGADFWRNRARVRHAGFVAEPRGGIGVGGFEVRNVYETAEPTPHVICEEQARYTLHVTPHGYLLSCDSVFTPTTGETVFGDQEEMGFGIRLATPLTVKHGNGCMLNSAGGLNERGTWGRQAPWCAGWGVIDGMHVGAVVIPSPANFRSAWFHSRDYGLIVANPFGKKAMTGPNNPGVLPDRTILKTGETLRLGFAVGLFSVKENPQAAIEALHAASLNAR